MNKAELINAVAEKAGLSKKDTEVAVNSLIEVITAALKKGDKVLAGQKIGEASGFISANVICSVSGTVKAVEPRRVASGAMVNSVVVENDGEYQSVEGMGQTGIPQSFPNRRSVIS